MKRQATYWENILVKHISDKELVSRIYRELSKIQENKPILKRCNKDLSRHFTEKDTQVANKHIKRCSTSLVTRKI